jgi:hypothetical protein
MITVTITYNTHVETFPIEEWASAQPHDVQKIEFRHDRTGYGADLQGHSLYWVYRLEHPPTSWALGEGSLVYATKPIIEMVFDDATGKVGKREQPFFPDMTHDRIKLGAWRTATQVSSFAAEHYSGAA